MVLCFGLGAFLGAPFVPTHRRSTKQALDLLDLEPGQRLLDLGSGSGTLLVAAAKRGLIVTGIEINPVLWFIATIRLWRYRGRAKIILGNYWRTSWPMADGIYVFLIGHYMERLGRRLHKLQHPAVVVSNIFAIPNLEASHHQDGLYRYDI